MDGGKVDYWLYHIDLIFIWVNNAEICVYIYTYSAGIVINHVHI